MQTKQTNKKKIKQQLSTLGTKMNARSERRVAGCVYAIDHRQQMLTPITVNKQSII